MLKKYDNEVDTATVADVKYYKNASDLCHGDVVFYDGILQVVDLAVNTRNTMCNVTMLEAYGSISSYTLVRTEVIPVVENIRRGGDFYAVFADVLADRAKLWRAEKTYSRYKRS